MTSRHPLASALGSYDGCGVTPPGVVEAGTADPGVGEPIAGPDALGALVALDVAAGAVVFGAGDTGGVGASKQPAAASATRIEAVARAVRFIRPSSTQTPSGDAGAGGGDRTRTLLQGTVFDTEQGK